MTKGTRTHEEKTAKVKEDKVIAPQSVRVHSSCICVGLGAKRVAYAAADRSCYTSGERGEIIASLSHFPDFYTKQALKV